MDVVIAIEEDLIAGFMSIADIAKQHGVAIETVVRINDDMLAREMADEQDE